MACASLCHSLHRVLYSFENALRLCCFLLLRPPNPCEKANEKFCHDKAILIESISVYF